MNTNINEEAIKLTEDLKYSSESFLKRMKTEDFWPAKLVEEHNTRVEVFSYVLALLSNAKAKLNNSPVTKENIYSETEQARNTMEYFIREWADDQNELSICEYLLDLVEEQEDWAKRHEKLISGSIWASVGECIAISSGSFCTSTTVILATDVQVTFLFKSDSKVTFTYGRDTSISYSMPLSQFLNMFQHVEKKKAKAKKTKQ